MRKHYVVLAGAALLLSSVIPTAQARPALHAEAERMDPVAEQVELVNLTSTGASVAYGNAVCPDQPYYLYSGGKADKFKGGVDRAYPSLNLAAYHAADPQDDVAYDNPDFVDVYVKDSFNLQNNRGVCHAVIQYRTKFAGGPPNDGFGIAHVEDDTVTKTNVAGVGNPGTTAAIQSYALDATGKELLRTLTGYYDPATRTPQQSILDLFSQDDTMLDFFRIYVWYGPNCVDDGTC